VTGVTVFAGMVGVTLFGLFLTPVFYVALRKWVIIHSKNEPVRNAIDQPRLVQGREP
jgi:multidrug efflux pump